MRRWRNVGSCPDAMLRFAQSEREVRFGYIDRFQSAFCNLTIQLLAVRIVQNALTDDHLVLTASCDGPCYIPESGLQLIWSIIVG